MRARIFGGAILLVAMLLALAPSPALAQQGGFQTDLGYAPPDNPSPLPIYSTRPGAGGLFFTGSAVFYRQNSPLEDQVVAVRGFYDVDGSITGTPGTFIGPGDTALDTGQVDGGPGNVQFGFRTSVGYRFGDGSAFEVSWMHLTKNLFAAVASLIPARHAINGDLSNTFLTSGVFNYPIDFGGPGLDVTAGVPGATFGIWNAADLMTIQFEQRNEFVDLMYRKPVHEDEYCRTFGYMGASFAWFWERFKWRTVDADVTGAISGPPFQAVYTNIISNRMYGAKIGMGHERYLGHGFSISFDAYASLYMDIAKIRFKYERGDKYTGPANKRAFAELSLVPAFQGTVFLWWYPIEGIQVRLGYDVMTFFNTFASPKPIDFDYSALNPGTERVFRILDGVQFGVSLSF